MAVTDKFRLASGSTRPVVTSLSLPKANGATTATITSATGWNTTTGVDVVIYRRQLNTTTNKYEKIDGTQTDWVAQLTGTTLSGMILSAGTEPASGYAADGNTVVMCAPTAQWNDDLIGGILLHANQDGSLKTAAVQTALGITASPAGGWELLNAGVGPNTVTYNGNRSYTLQFNGVDLTSAISAGMRLRTTRTVPAPIQSTSLNGTSQYYSKAAPAGMTFTDDFTVGAWVKLNSYAVGVIASCYNGTSGWQYYLDSSGRITLAGYNAGAVNVRQVQSYQSVPLNKWVYVTAQLDMSAYPTTSATQNYVMIDGVDVPAVMTQGGTNPVALVQAGDFQIGAGNSAAFFPGKIAQAFVSSAKITQANVRLLMSQGLTASLISTHSIISAYSFSNSITDLNTTNANNLTANGGAVATATDSPFGDSGTSSTLDYAIVSAKPTFSINTTVVVQVPEGCTIPTSGGVSNVYYSNVAVPYGFPKSTAKWTIEVLIGARVASATGIAANTLTNPGSVQIVPPIGEWRLGYQVSCLTLLSVAAAYPQFNAGLSTSASAVNDYGLMQSSPTVSSSVNQINAGLSKNKVITQVTAVPYYFIIKGLTTAVTHQLFIGTDATLVAELGVISAENAYL